MKKVLPIIFFLLGLIIVLIVGYWIYKEPMLEAEERNQYEDYLIEDYLDNEDDGVPVSEEPLVDYHHSDINNYTFRGNIDCILVIDKINLKKAIIKGNQLSDNDYNLDKYYFVTADLTSTLNENYVIYGHSSETYGHSFNRLEEVGVGDTFYILQNDEKYSYEVESVERALRSESERLLPNLNNRVTLISCEKNLARGYSEKRVIVVRAKVNN